MAEFDDDQNDNLESAMPTMSEALPDIRQAELQKLDAAVERFLARASLEELKELNQAFDILKSLRKASVN